MTDRVAVGVIDTSVVIDLGDLAPGMLPIRPRISTITLAELALGLHTTRLSSERAVRGERIQQAEAGFDPLPFTTSAARRFGQFVGLVKGIGRNPPPRRQDLMIAATASVNDLPLFTRNPDDFRGLESVLTVVPV